MSAIATEPETRGMPSCADVVSHLRTEGSSESRLRAIEEWIGANPDSDASGLLEWMVTLAQAGDKTIRKGTVEKAGKYIRGPAFAMTMPGESFSDEVNRLRVALDEAQRGKLTSDRTAAAYLKELTARRTELERATATIADLTAERDHYRLQCQPSTPLPDARKPETKKTDARKPETKNLQPVG